MSTQHTITQMQTISSTTNLRRYLDQEGENYYQGSGDLGAGVLPFIFIIFFFFVWNGLLASNVLAAFYDISHGECTGAVLFLLCPHWIIGIIIPGLFGYAYGGVLGVFLNLSISVVIPYGLHIWRIRELWDEDHGHLCFCFGRRRNDADTFEDIPDVETGVNPSTLTGARRKAYLEKTLIFSKVVEGRIRDTDDVSKSFRETHPKSDLVIAKEGKDETITASKRETVCTICFEPYKKNDTICWSPNPACHHAFHKDCAMDWLMQKTECPVCRRAYIGEEATKEADSNER